MSDLTPPSSLTGLERDEEDAQEDGEGAEAEETA